MGYSVVIIWFFSFRFLYYSKQRSSGTILYYLKCENYFELSDLWIFEHFSLRIVKSVKLCVSTWMLVIDSDLESWTFGLWVGVLLSGTWRFALWIFEMWVFWSMKNFNFEYFGFRVSWRCEFFECWVWKNSNVNISLFLIVNVLKSAHVLLIFPLHLFDQRTRSIVNILLLIVVNAWAPQLLLFVFPFHIHLCTSAMKIYNLYNII